MLKVSFLALPVEGANPTAAALVVSHGAQTRSGHCEDAPRLAGCDQGALCGAFSSLSLPASVIFVPLPSGVLRKQGKEQRCLLQGAPELSLGKGKF